jgi:hypothetical protein
MHSGTNPRGQSPLRKRLITCVAWVTALQPLTWTTDALGQFGFGIGAVGGIAIDADGIVRNLDPQAATALAEERRRVLRSAPEGPAAPAELRKVSLARLVAAVEEATASQRPLPPEVTFLGGLERITHVFVDPDGHDVILAGPADAATIDATGTVVGATRGRPLLHLEDFVVALRTIDAARAGGIKCSIDPTADGIKRLKTLLDRQKTVGQNPDAMLVSMQDALGPQQVTVGGVPADSRFARVLVAADYRLKRLGMGLEPSGVAALPSYLSMVPPTGSSATLPRFWLEADYDPIARDPDELAWRLSGRRMKCLTESAAFSADGVRRGRAGVDATAERWCALMTANYDGVADKQPVFAELVNCVDLAVVAALIRGRQLDARAGLDLSPLFDETRLRLPSYEVPASVPTVAHGLKKGGRWVVSASGGVLFQPWSFATNTADSADVADARATALAARQSASWWWD